MAFDLLLIAQLLSTFIVGVIAVVGVLYEFRRSDGALTWPGRVAVLGAVASSGIGVFSTIRGDQNAKQQARAAEEAHAIERQEYETLLARSNRMISEAREQLYPVEDWLIRFSAERRLEAEAEEQALHEIFVRMVREQFGDDILTVEGINPHIYLDEDELRKATREVEEQFGKGDDSFFLPGPQPCRINFAADASGGDIQANTLSFPGSYMCDPGGVAYFPHSRSLVYFGDVPATSVLLQGDQPTRSVYDLAGRTVRVVAKSRLWSMKELTVGGVTIEYGTPLLQQTFRNESDSGVLVIRYPCPGEELSEDGCSDEGMLEWIHANTSSGWLTLLP